MTTSANDRPSAPFLKPMRHNASPSYGNQGITDLPLVECRRAARDDDWTEEVDADRFGEMSTPCQGDDGNDREKRTDPAYVDDLEPLRPKTRRADSGGLDQSEKHARRSELLSRLSDAFKRLQRYEQCTETNWRLDSSLLDAKDDPSAGAAKLPKRVEDNIEGIVESACDYVRKLEEQLRDLDSADRQIARSTEKTCKDIDDTYQALLDELCQQINRKRSLMRLETEVYKCESLAPLKACRQEVNAQIRSTRHLVDLARTMLERPHTFNRDRLNRIVAASSNMGRIPAVPTPEEIPYVTFNRPSDHAKDELSSRIFDLGCVLRTGPVQFTETEERPACLLVKWCVTDPEYAAEEQTFVVQRAIGEILDPASNVFETVYEGPETVCFVRDLPVDRSVTLRVGIQASDTAWSTHRVARTTIPAYSWELDNKNYMITNDGRIAAKITDAISTVLSRGPQFNADHVIEFKFLETAKDATDDEGVALAYEPTGDRDTLKRSGALLITPRGKVFVDGEEKLMQLPRFRFGTRLAFSAHRKDGQTLRVGVECADKAVTYDWNVRTPLHFAARFAEYNKWNLIVK